MASILGNEWHISSVGSDILTENGYIKDKQQVYNQALNTDLKDICRPVLNEFTNTETPKTVLQVHKIRNISAPKANEESQAAPRMLKLTLTDGEGYIQAIEFSTIPSISSKNTPPGTKLLIEKVIIVSGYLLLKPQNCKILGGKVESLFDKWELTKNVQRNRINYDGEDGPPPWVNFGTKIKAGNQENNFKSIAEKAKETKEASEFEQQRKDAIAEASSGAVRKVFSGRVKQNVQVQSGANVKKYPEKSRERKESKGRTLVREKEIDEKPQKPSEKVSLFSFLEDKLPVTNTQSNVYQSHTNKLIFKETECSDDDTNRYDYKRKPKEYQKPDYNKNQGKARNNNFRRENLDNPQKNSFNNSKQSNYISQNFDHTTEDQQKQKTNSFPQNYPQNSNFNRYDQYRQKNHPQPSNYFQNTPENNPFPQQTSTYLQPNNSYPIQSNNQNSNTFTKQPYQRHNQNEINDLTQEVQKMALNSQFASRTLRQHLNLDGVKRSDNAVGKTTGEMNVGDEIMAKYWEDGKYYNATIISITDKTFAVKFKGYGNIEEILKSDCKPLLHSNNRNNLNQQSDRSHKPYSGSAEYRRRNYN